MRTIEEIEADIVRREAEIQTGTRYGQLPNLELARCKNELCLALVENISTSRLKELCQAERENRCVVLPCKVGDTLWIYDRDGKPRQMILDAPDIRCHCAKEDNLCMALCDAKKTGVCARRLKNDGTDFGKTVFLTREEAEIAMKGDKN